MTVPYLQIRLKGAISYDFKRLHSKRNKKNKIELGTWNYLNDLPIMHIKSKIKKENGNYATINFVINHISLLIYDKDCKQNYVYLGKKDNSIFLENCDLSLFEIEEL